jgi:hypothetical protein
MIGKWGDHYSWPHRNFITGEVQYPNSGWFNDRFWRPLGVLTSKLQVTYLWNWDWAVHLVGALAQAWAAFMVYWFLVRTCRWKPLAGAGALVFLTYGPGYEVVFWPMSTSASFAIVCLMWGFQLVVRYAGGASGWRTLPWIGLVAFLIPCLFEQMAPWPALIPFLYLAFCRESEPWSARLSRAILAAIVCIPGCVLYLGLMIGTMPPNLRGGTGSFIHAEELPARLAIIWRHIFDNMTMAGYWKGALDEGLLQIGHLRRAAPLVALGVVIAAYFWLEPWLRYVRARGARGPGPRARAKAGAEPGARGASRPIRQRSPRLAWFLFFCAAGFVASWLTVIVTRDQPVLFRLCQAPVVFVIFAVCAVVDAQLARSARRCSMEGLAGRWAGIVGVTARLVTLGATLWLCAWGTLVMIGSASVMKARSELDYQEGKQLKKLVPDPPLNAVFIPLYTENYPFGVTRTPALEAAVGGVWLWHWAPFRFVQMIYKREDLASTHYFRDARGLPFDWIDERGWQYADYLGGNFGPTDTPPRPLRWDEVIPFVILADGSMYLVRSVKLVRSDGTQMHMPVPIVEKLCADAKADRPCLEWSVIGKTRAPAPALRPAPRAPSAGEPTAPAPAPASPASPR